MALPNVADRKEKQTVISFAEDLKKYKKNFQKGIDNLEIMWYNINVIKRWEHSPTKQKERGNKNEKI